MTFGAEVVAGCFSMFVRDALATTLVIAEAKGKAALAGLMDVGGDLAQIAVTVFTAGAVITHGVTPSVVVLVGALSVTSFFTTMTFTKLGRRMEAEVEPASTEERKAATPPWRPTP